MRLRATLPVIFATVAIVGLITVIFSFQSDPAEGQQQPGPLGIRCALDDVIAVEERLIGPDATTGGSDARDGLRIYLQQSPAFNSMSSTAFERVSEGPGRAVFALERAGVRRAAAEVIVSNEFWLVEAFSACQSEVSRDQG